MLDFNLEYNRGSFNVSAALRLGVERIALMGPSGSGKSTVLDLVAGLLQPCHGHISFNGSTWFDKEAGIDLSPPARRVGYVFQDSALFPHMSVLQNIQYGPKALHFEDWDHVHSLLDLFHLTDLQQKRPRHLSGGEKRRTAIARALASKPQLLLLDEPFTGIDQTARTRIMKELLLAQEKLHMPILLATHEPEVARQLSATVVHIQNGKLSAI